ncbi:hypothetical protein [Loktanella salsilacus]|jgi:hypothetical protein|uniref:hypothetical protein n=1 Tax=Loktanella salsilacus TaxID=195913 RepID=UPI0030F55565
MTSEKLSGLARLTDAAFLSEQGKLAKLSRKEAELRAQLAHLLEDRAMTAHADRPLGDAALAAGADIRWHQWIAVRQTRLNAELLQIMELKRLQLRNVRKAHGRAQALEQLTLRAQADARRKKAARQDRDIG